jgi:hypothetical protein
MSREPLENLAKCIERSILWKILHSTGTCQGTRYVVPKDQPVLAHSCLIYFSSRYIFHHVIAATQKKVCNKSLAQCCSLAEHLSIYHA